MRRDIGCIIGVIILCLSCGTGFASESAKVRFTEQIDNVAFDAAVSGAEITQAVLYTTVLKPSDPSKDSFVIELFNQMLFQEEPQLELEELKDKNGRVKERCYFTRKNEERECCNYFFCDGAIGADTYEATFYFGIMDITSAQYGVSRYIYDRLECGDLPMMTAKEATTNMREIAEQLELNVEQTPYIARAYTMDEQLASTSGFHPYLKLVSQGNELTAENRAVVSAYGSDCYLITYRYTFDGIPVSYSYYYIESKDYFTLSCDVTALYNNRGLIRFFALNQYEVIDVSEAHELISWREAAECVAEDFSLILGVEPFVCREISLEYIPLAYDGCDIEREACLTPAWVFYFDDLDMTAVAVNAIDGQIIR